MAIIFLHIVAVTMESMVEISNGRKLDDLLEAPDVDGYYYEFIDAQDGFKIIKHTEAEPYPKVQNAHYSGPISPTQFLDICANGEPRFIGAATSDVVEVIVKEPSPQMLEKLRESANGYMGFSVEDKKDLH